MSNFTEYKLALFHLEAETLLTNNKLNISQELINKSRTLIYNFINNVLEENDIISKMVASRLKEIKKDSLSYWIEDYEKIRDKLESSKKLTRSDLNLVEYLVKLSKVR